MIPTEKQILSFLRENKNQSISSLARKFKVHRQTMTDIMKDLQKRKNVAMHRGGNAKIYNTAE